MEIAWRGPPLLGSPDRASGPVSRFDPRRGTACLLDWKAAGAGYGAWAIGAEMPGATEGNSSRQGPFAHGAASRVCEPCLNARLVELMPARQLYHKLTSSWLLQTHRTGILGKYARLVSSSSRGATTDIAD